jgi:hypothetical protein
LWPLPSWPPPAPVPSRMYHESHPTLIRLYPRHLDRHHTLREHPIQLL